jgi:hypothetical protein
MGGRSFVVKLGSHMGKKGEEDEKAGGYGPTPCLRNEEHADDWCMRERQMNGVNKRCLVVLVVMFDG